MRSSDAVHTVHLITMSPSMSLVLPIPACSCLFARLCVVFSLAFSFYMSLSVFRYRAGINLITHMCEYMCIRSQMSRNMMKCRHTHAPLSYIVLKIWMNEVSQTCESIVGRFRANWQNKNSRPFTIWGFEFWSWHLMQDSVSLVDTFNVTWFWYPQDSLTGANNIKKVWKV